MRSDIIFGDYLLIKRIGVGGMSEVFRAQRIVRAPGEPDLALKRLLPAWQDDHQIAQLFMREVEALRRISHPAVVRLIDAGVLHGIPFVVVPWIDGANLRRLLRATGRNDQQERLPLQACLWLGYQLALGLDAAHRTGVVHRDVSPSNVLVDQQGKVLLIDFGIARVAGLAQTTHGQGLRGKWAYASPEQVAGLPLDHRTDLFSLGSVVVEALHGQAPFGDADRELTLARIGRAEPLVWPLLPPELADVDALLKRMVAVAPDDRPPSAERVAHGFAGALARCGDPEGYLARAQLAERTTHLPPFAERSEALPAELRGEDVTRPEVDGDATLVGQDS